MQSSIPAHNPLVSTFGDCGFMIGFLSGQVVLSLSQSREVSSPSLSGWMTTALKGSLPFLFSGLGLCIMYHFLISCRTMMASPLVGRSIYRHSSSPCQCSCFLSLYGLGQSGYCSPERGEVPLTLVEKL